MPARETSPANARAASPNIDDRFFFCGSRIAKPYYTLQCNRPAHSKDFWYFFKPEETPRSHRPSRPKQESHGPRPSIGCKAKPCEKRANHLCEQGMCRSHCAESGGCRVSGHQDFFDELASTAAGCKAEPRPRKDRRKMTYSESQHPQPYELNAATSQYLYPSYPVFRNLCSVNMTKILFQGRAAESTKVVHGRLHQLQELSFRSDVPHAAPWTNSALNAFELAPRLGVVRFNGSRNIDEIYALPFRQIKTVEFSITGSIFCCDALLKFPNIQELVITDCREGSAHHPQLQSTLKKITLRREDGNQLKAMAVIRCLTAPKLEELHFHDHAWDTTSITEFLTRSACSLKILFIENVRVRAGELLDLLRHAPTLHTLELLDSIPNSLTDILISALTPVAGSEPLLPALKNIVFVGTYLFSTNGILRMLEGRAASLRSVTLVLPDRQLSAADRARFANLCSASVGVWWLRCLDEERRLVEVQ
ncbi:hypothetical protein C8R47DRAFT_1064342 [Mycena vitilis]|nr:hypothetical protein C8R47DRAFT_1064342 [Mycena vitilis]